MIRFLSVSPDQVDALPFEAVEFLDNAIKRTPASTACLDMTMDIARKGFGNIYIVMDEEEIVGATYILSYDTPEGKIISPVLLGGKNMKKWRDDYFNFITNFARTLSSPYIRFVARKGWERFYPMCKNIGTIYEFDLRH